MKHLQNFIKGEWSDALQGKTLPLINPATGERVGILPRSLQEDTEAAIAAAESAFSQQRQSRQRDRVELLRFVAQQLENQTDELARLETEDVGKPLWLSRTVDLPRAVANFRFFADLLETDQVDATAMDHALNYTQRRPLGVVALITPWNLPLYLLSWKVAPALAMGNTVVAKPSELTPQTATALARVFSLAETKGLVPPGVFNLVHGLGPEAGDPLCRSPRVAALSFTGGTDTGRVVAQAAAGTFKKTSLELGGKNPSVVFANSLTPEHAETTVSGVLRAAFLNSGQICLCGSRILVEQSGLNTFLELAQEQLSSWEPGDPLQENTPMGPVVSAEQLKKLQAALEQAEEQGAVMLQGKDHTLPDGNGFFLRPALVTGLPHSSDFAQREHFGPLASVHPFTDEADAISLANDTPYGLAASVWTQQQGQAQRVAEALDVGMVWVNTWLYRDLRVPFGGTKSSGVGREGGRRSFEFYSDAKNICLYAKPEGNLSK